MIEKHITFQDRLASLRKANDLGGILEKFGILIAYIVLIIVSTILSPHFLSTGNLLNVIRQISIVGILAIGQTFVILIAGIDLSVGASLALVVVLVGGFLQKYGVVPAILMGFLVGAIVGMVNGIGVAFGNLPPFVMTLGMSGIARGLAYVYTGGMPIPVIDPAFLYIGSGYFLGIPVPAIIFVVLVIIAALILRYTVFGRYVYSIGSNAEAARLSGINVNLIKILVYVLCGLMCTIAGDPVCL